MLLNGGDCRQNDVDGGGQIESCRPLRMLARVAKVETRTAIVCAVLNPVVATDEQKVVRAGNRNAFARSLSLDLAARILPARQRAVDLLDPLAAHFEGVEKDEPRFVNFEFKQKRRALRAVLAVLLNRIGTAFAARRIVIVFAHRVKGGFVLFAENAKAGLTVAAMLPVSAHQFGHDRAGDDGKQRRDGEPQEEKSDVVER